MSNLKDAVAAMKEKLAQAPKPEVKKVEAKKEETKKTEAKSAVEKVKALKEKPTRQKAAGGLNYKEICEAIGSVSKKLIVDHKGDNMGYSRVTHPDVGGTFMAANKIVVNVNQFKPEWAAEFPEVEPFTKNSRGWFVLKPEIVTNLEQVKAFAAKYLTKRIAGAIAKTEKPKAEVTKAAAKKPEVKPVKTEAKKEETKKERKPVKTEAKPAEEPVIENIATDAPAQSEEPVGASA